ncbi:type I restriction enzyme S subunit [Nocardia tenerifensis]|uniref:Type I restriction enzyme S subunit n=1 Tax=Nocardia tenerifensis TaxID=228006 RepID=A0A318K664_9NOCA|nr:restriction endonuclease subunit S [Nocardia tenerifensis]PXX68525.1 type I restriction enzyme S subunit [Nocardia tenerifensis]
MTIAHSIWGTRRLKLLTTKIGSGKTPSGGAETYQDSGVIFLRSQNIHFDGLRLNDVAYIDEDVHCEMRGTRVMPGDVLLNITGASLGRVTNFPEGLGEANVNQHVCIIRPSEIVDSKFLSYALASHPSQGQILSMQVGGNRDGLNFEQVGRLEIPVPEIESQRRIADFIDAETARIDKLATLRREALALLAEREMAVRDSLVDGLAQKFGEVPLRRFITRIDQGASPQCESYPRDGTEWAVLKLSSIKRGRFNAEENKRLPSDMKPNSEHEIRQGDLLVTRANTPQLVGDVAVASGDIKGLLLPDLIYRITLDSRLSSEYVAQIALSGRIRTLIESIARGSSQSMVKLRGEDIREWLIPVADEEQQESFIREAKRCASATDRAANAIRHQLDLLAERRQTLITAAVTGQLDVTTALRATA